MTESWFGEARWVRWATYGLSLSLAAILSLIITPRVRAAAIRFGIVDRPDGKLKTHDEPVAYLGGLAVCLAFLLTLAVTATFDSEVLAILLAGSIVVILGLVDDLGQLGPWTKLCGQLVAILVLLKAGVYIKLVFLPPALAVALSVVWLLAVTNAFNLIDIMDGLSAGTAMVAALTLALVSEMNGAVTAAILLATLAGACLGFLRYNFEPAKIYMGDTGSMFLGLLLGALTMSNAYTQRNPLAALAPALILGVPLFDMLFVMYIRWRRGLPVMLGSPDHVALRLRKWRLSTKQTVAASYLATAVLGGSAIVIMILPLGGALSVLGLLVTAAFILALLLRRVDMGM